MSFAKTQLYVCPATEIGHIQIICDNPTTAFDLASQAKREGYESAIREQATVIIKQPIEEVQAFLTKLNFVLESCKYSRRELAA